MKQKRLIVILALSIILGGAAGLLALKFLNERARPLEAAPTAPAGMLMVAAANLEVGAVLRAEDVRAVEWHSDVLPEGYYGTPGEVIGRGLIRAVSANEPLMASKLVDTDGNGGLSITIPSGMRAITVRVDEVIGVAGFVLPGTRVDVLLTIQADAGPTITQIILQNIEALAVDQTVTRDAQGTPITVSTGTFAVTPEQALRLTLASTEGRIQLALRNPLDVAETRTQGIRASALIDGQRAAAAPPGTAVRVAPPPARVEPATQVIESIRGGDRTLSTFQQSNP